MKTLLRFAVVCALLIAMSGAIVACGQKGDLVRPAPAAPADASGTG